MKTIEKIEKIPFLDLIAPHQELKEELCASFEKALEKGAFVGGAAVEEFEKDFAKFCDTEYCVGVGSGTDALRFAIMAAGLKTGSIVVTVPNTFIATTEAISQAGSLSISSISTSALSIWIPGSFANTSKSNALSIPARVTSSTGASCGRWAPLFRSISTAKPRTWIRYWNSRNATACR